VSGPLHDGQAAGLENLLEAGQTWMKAERDARRIRPDLQHPGRRHPQRGTAARVERIVVWNHHAERVVAAAQIEDHEIAQLGALRRSQIAHEFRRRERDRKRGHAAFDELTPGDLHWSWYSGDPAIRWTSPAAFA